MRLQLDTTTLTPADGGRVTAPSSSGAPDDVRAGERRAANTDSIGISGTSAALSQLSGERAERIQQLTSAVRAGTYGVSGAAISNAIVTQAFTQ
jgi:anti-sigma28 factor (negative regulator of flagellin synthesis)